MENIGELTNLAQKVKKILKEELQVSGIEYDIAEARMYDKRSVGVQGDQRTYGYLTEIELSKKGNFLWDEEFLRKLSARITNEVRGVNRVIYVVGDRKLDE